MVTSPGSRFFWIIVVASAPFKVRPALSPAIGALAVAMISVQSGAALVKRLFPIVGVAGATTLRLVLAGLILGAVFRPWRLRPTPKQALDLALYAAAMGCMNFCFYNALSRVPLGIAVAIEFTGPLALAVATSHRALDYVWVALAALGLVALLPLGYHSLSTAGMLFALAAGAFWAMYIIYGQKVGAAHGAASTALGTIGAALLIAPFGLWQAGRAMFDPAILPAALTVAVLSSAVPYSLEMVALVRMPAKTFGVLMSAEPALAALAGVALLHERLSLVQWAAIASIMAASAGCALTGTAGLPARPE